MIKRFIACLPVFDPCPAANRLRVSYILAQRRGIVKYENIPSDIGKSDMPAMRAIAALSC
jgi:hypothetical protein